MNWSTPLKVEKRKPQLHAGDSLLLMGSCFAANLGEKLQDLPLHCLSQPLGTLFHPLAIHQALDRKAFDRIPCYEWEGHFYHPFFHSQFSARDKETLRSQILLAQEQSLQHLQQSQWLVLTYGTAHYYQDLVFQQAVANCHKQDQQRFEKRRSDLAFLIQQSRSWMEGLFQQLPNLTILLTLSPVRHIKDGLEENQISKAILRLLIEDLVQHFPQVHYFPAYELLLDELRDYRFYAPDLIHPSTTAVDYIYEQFKVQCLSPELEAQASEWERYAQMRKHRPSPQGQEAHELLLEKMRQRLGIKDSHSN